MALERAAFHDSDLQESAEPNYDETVYSMERGIPQPLPVPLIGETRFIKDPNGWLHLIKDGKESQAPMLYDHRKSIAPPGMTLNDLVMAHEERTARWKEASCCAEMIEFFQSTISKVQDFTLKSCICIGIGTFTGTHPYCPGDRSFDQLIAFEAILDTLRQTHEIPDVFIQDPVMNSLDAEFLRSRGFTVLENPAAQNLATPTSLLFAPNCEWHVIQETFEIAYPGLFIGVELECYLDCIGYGPVTSTSKEEREALETLGQQSRERNRQMFERVYKPFFNTRLSRDIVTEPDGQTGRVYWKG